jgi:hypothetical protein
MDNQHLLIDALIAERDDLKRHGLRLQCLLDGLGHPPGHYYSPLVDVDDDHVVRAVQQRLQAPLPKGVEFDPDAMRIMLRRLAAHHHLFPFPPDDNGRNRFYFNNPFFGCHDAAIYFSMLLEFRPRRLIEIGSGFSSRLLLDSTEQFPDDGVNITLIDPSLDSLNLRAPPQTRLFRRRVQDVDLTIFDQLDANDILFIDSSHVSKTGSDVNFILFEIFPRLRPGVLIHIHDIFWPFEYLREWVLNEKRSWNETYLIHAFLQYNSSFGILYWNNFAFHFLESDLRQLMPLCLQNEGGSLWIRRKS